MAKFGEWVVLKSNSVSTLTEKSWGTGKRRTLKGVTSIVV
jgi:hypothetical protein